MSRKKRDKYGRQDIVELGKDTDPQICRDWQGREGKDGLCRVITTKEEDGIHIRPVSDKDKASNE